MELLLTGTNVGQQLLGSRGGHEQQLLSTGDAGVPNQLQQLLLQGGHLGGNSTTNGIFGSAANSVHQYGLAPNPQTNQAYQQLQRALRQQHSMPQSLAPLMSLSSQQQPQLLQPQNTSSSSLETIAASVLQLLQSGHLNPAQAQQLIFTAMNSQRGIVSGIARSPPCGNTNNSGQQQQNQHQHALLQQLLLVSRSQQLQPHPCQTQPLWNNPPGSIETNPTVVNHSNQQVMPSESQMVQHAQQLLMLSGDPYSTGTVANSNLEIVRAAGATSVAQFLQSLGHQQQLARPTS
jgi:hypothetical protein